jgi:hypothetical protein
MNKLELAVDAVLRDALDRVEVHPCDENNDEIKFNGLSDEFKSLYQARYVKEKVINKKESRICKRLMDLFNKGELIRIKETGEVFTYESSTGGANFSSYLVINVNENLIEYRKSLLVNNVEKVDLQGNVIDDFKQYLD